ncbi:hypothetical protein CLV24_101244 [Pontibacter ummariensis]|uniref:SpoIIAA-like n=1 Tax=Pontibacter ummariensis TaxID=1610492 RepID=A0A239BA40_9BACT|nr:hypothetical protein [Pontibacter ummariensis]PRY16399.1 hypothetical protein CLV24_101244 [Pontibacter ummariensis]SNS04482.1 hypothetical protein SAMN06296052_101244 [Pontibacter ummariensis]
MSGQLLYSEWVRKPARAEYREAATIVAELLRGKDIAFWIQDTGKLGRVSEEELEFVIAELLPVAAASSLTRLARISTDETNMEKFRRLAGEAKAELNDSIQVRQFRTYREAVEWIEQRL